MKKAAALIVCLMMFAACVDEGPVALRTPPPGAREGGTLVVATSPLTSVDPAQAFDPSSKMVAQTMCDQLINFDPVSGKPVGGLAESWTTTAKGARLIIKLRKDARFSDGSEVKADDIAFTLSRLASEEQASPAARIIQPIAGFEFMHGDVETDDERLLSKLVGVRPIEGRSLEIQLDQPMAEFFKALSHPATSPVSQEAYKKDPKGFASRPVCAGPYRLGSPWEPGKTVVLERTKNYVAMNPAYTSGGAGFAERIEFRPFATRDEEFAAFSSPDIDIAHVPGAKRAEAKQLGDSYVEAATDQLEMIGLPTSQPPFDAPETRAALSLALDRSRIASEVYAGSRVPALSFTVRGKASKAKDACTLTMKASADPELAKTLISRSKAELAGRPLKIYYNDEFQNAALASAVAAQWAQTFGANVTTIAMDWEPYLSQGVSSKGFDGAFRYSWSPEYPSPDRVLHPLFHTDSIGRDNLSRFSSPSFRESLSAARRTIDDRTRAASYERAEAIVCEQMPAIPIVFSVKGFVMRKDRIAFTGDALFDPSSSEPVLREIYVKG